MRSIEVSRLGRSRARVGWTRLVAGLLLVGGLSWGLSTSGAVATASASRLGAGLGVAWICWVLRRVAWPEMASEGAFEQALRPSPEPRASFPSSYSEIRRTVVLACSSHGAHPAEYKLRPLLQALAAQRLALRHGIDIGTQPEAALEMLGADLFAVVSREQAVPAHRLKEEPGVPLEKLDDWLTRLASI